MKVVFTHYYPRQPFDTDNLIGGLKYARDALTQYGLIHDDSPKWIDAEYRQQKAKKYGLDIEITELDSSP